MEKWNQTVEELRIYGTIFYDYFIKNFDSKFKIQSSSRSYRLNAQTCLTLDLSLT